MLGLVLLLLALLNASLLADGSLPSRAGGQQQVYATMSPQNPAPDPVEAAMLTSASRECGMNAVYMLLRLRCASVSYDEVKRVVEAGPHGSSMLQLREAVGRLGLRAAVTKCSPRDLSRCSMPVIAHLKTHSHFKMDTGHYVVVFSVDDSGIEVLDGTSGRIQKYAVERFPAYWSGYLLIPDPPFSWDRWGTLATAGLWVALGLWWRHERKKMAGSTWARASQLPAAPGVSTELQKVTTTKSTKNANNEAEKVARH